MDPDLVFDPFDPMAEKADVGMFDAEEQEEAGFSRRPGRTPAVPHTLGTTPSGELCPQSTQMARSPADCPRHTSSEVRTTA